MEKGRKRGNDTMKKAKISMSKKTNQPTIREAFDLFVKKCRVKNLTDESIASYNRKISRFYDFIDKESPIASVGKETVDNYILWLRENSKANDITMYAMNNLTVFHYEESMR